jgi:hypothetical protein
MLCCVEADRELEYIPFDGAPRHGPAPPRLAPRPKFASVGFSS